jgi:hypothetical protein
MANERNALPFAVVIPSTDKYADVWPLTLASFERFWPGREAPVYLISNERRMARAQTGVEQLLVGTDTTWSDVLARGLRQIEADRVLLWIDDLVLTHAVDTSRLDGLVSWARDRDATYVRLNPRPRGVRLVDRALSLREVPSGALYRTATVCALWKRTALISLLDARESAWQFEIEGSLRSDGVDGFYASDEPTFAFENVVVKGRTDPRALRRVEAAGLGGFPLGWPPLTSTDLTRLALKEMRSRVMNGVVPWRWRRQVRGLLAWTGVAGAR